ncbi:MAG: hypothetical protein OXI44_12115, partial [Bacteroidota bacterium]|nr:hypothetical protein [Bacteroidota bacterium]
MKITDRNRIHFVGSIAGNNADEVFRNCCGAVGDYLARIPDGETGYRSKYISHLAHTVYARHPDVVTVSRPPPVDPDNPQEWRKPGEDWIPMATDASDLWKFGLRKGVRTLRFETLGYAEAAIESYKAFCAVREQGIIPEGVRFQVSLPAAVDGMGFFVDRFADMRYFIPAYENAMAADIRRMLEVIPPGDLAIQWDNVASVLEHEARVAGHKLPVKIPFLARLLMGSPDKRFRQILKTFAANVPPEVEFGIHFCYGDIGHKHIFEPRDLSVCVHLANEAVNHAGRKVNWVHIPAPRDRKDDAYYWPLQHLSDATHLYLGLVHLTDGVKGTKTRIEVARKYKTPFGISTECGFGRRPPETIPALLELHKEAASLI